VFFFPFTKSIFIACHTTQLKKSTTQAKWSSLRHAHKKKNNNYTERKNLDVVSEEAEEEEANWAIEAEEAEAIWAARSRSMRREAGAIEGPGVEPDDDAALGLVK